MAFNIFNKYWWIARRLQTNQLQKKSSSELQFSEKDLYSVDISQRGGDFFLGYYSKEGLVTALKKYGVYDLLQGKGFNDVFTTIDTSDIYKHRLSIYDKQKDVNHLLVEVVLRKEFISINMPFENELQHKKIETLTIDWLSMQNPLGKFTSERPQLPGQKFPGLGFSRVAIEILLIISWRLNLAGLINIPEHFHNACFYSKIFYYINPDIQAKFLALKNDFKKIPVSKASWGINWGCVFDTVNNKPFEWIVDKQVVPMDKKLKKLILGNEYKHFVDKQKANYHFSFDEERYEYFKNKTSKEDMENII